MKKVLSIVLSVVTVLSLFTCAAAFAEDSYYFDENGRIVISSFGDDSESVMKNAENERYDSAVSKLNKDGNEAIKTLEGRIAKIVDYYKGTDEQYNAEVKLISDAVSVLVAQFEAADSDDERTRIQSEIDEKNNEFNNLSTLHTNRMQRDILVGELESRKAELKAALDAELELHNSNLSEISSAAEAYKQQKREEEERKKQNPDSKDVTPAPAPQQGTENTSVPQETAPNLAKSKIVSVKKKGKKYVIKWKKVSGADGYVIQYSTKKSFKKKTVKTVYVKNPNAASKAVKKLKKGKYYFRIRAYKQGSSNTYYSPWSKTKAVKLR